MSSLCIADALYQGRQELALVSDAPQLEARHLLAYVLGQSTAWLLARPKTLLSSEDAQRWQQVLAKRKTGKPLAYIIGQQAFYHWDFTVNPDVLIPRPETEELVGLVYEWARQTKSDLTLVDVGTGSGVIAIALALLLPEAQILATDISPAALQTAMGNAEKLGASNLRFFEGNLLQALPAGTKVDAIVANLPYIQHDELANLAVSHWEPSLALDGGTDGLSLIRSLLQQAPTYLNSEAYLFLEIGADQGDFFRQLPIDAAHLAVLHDLSGRDRMVRMKLLETHSCL